jgi:MoxR-like ATPase
MITTQLEIEQVARAVEVASAPFRRLLEQMHGVIIGQDALLHRMLVGLLSNGHMLIEGVPGLAKTMAVSCLARGINTKFQRLQFTPDLLPSDLIGTLIFRPTDGTFVVQKGPVFSNIILADEINRAPAKVQSGLLEAMQERQVTVGRPTYRLDEPFLVLATQNPIEQEGTYPLPEAQVGRFMLKLVVDYPSETEERAILERMAFTAPDLDIDVVMTPDHVCEARKLVDQIYIDDKIKDYVVDLTFATREPAAFGLPIDDWIMYGASPRATLAMTVAAKASALLAGRGYVTPQDVKDVAMDVLRHRIIVTYEAEAEERTPEDIVRTVLNHVSVP